jgi:tetratricopeptide (TPR) repeat protein
VRERHAHFFLDLVERSVGELRGPDQARWLRTLDDEHHNTRVAFEWADEQEDAGVLLRLLYGSWHYWESRGFFSEAEHWTERALLRKDVEDPNVLARALWGAGNVFLARGDVGRAREIWERALQVVRDAGDREGIGTVLRSLGTLRVIAFDFEGARTLCEEALELFRSIDDRTGIAVALLGLGAVARYQKDYARSLPLLEESRDRYRALGDEDGAARAILNIGVAYRDRGDAGPAIRPIREATEIWQRLGSPWDLIDCMEDWGALQSLLGDFEAAALFFGVAHEQREVLGLPPWDVEVAQLEPHVEKARAVLGATAYEEAFLRGRALSLDDAVARLLGSEVGSRSPEGS